MEQGSKPQGSCQTKGARLPCGQSHCLMAPLQALVWIAQIPQGLGCIEAAHHPRIIRTDGARVLLEVIQSHPLLQVCPSRGQLSKEVQCLPQVQVSPREEIPVLEALGQPQQL